MIVRGKLWARRITTVTFIFGAIAGFVFLQQSANVVPAEQSYILIEQVVSLILRLAGLWLLWFSPEVRTYLAGGRVSALQT
jgi:hypothetical protein